MLGPLRSLSVWLVPAALLGPGLGLSGAGGPRLCVAPLVEMDPPVIIRPYSPPPPPPPIRVVVVPPRVVVRPYVAPAIRFAQPPPPIRIVPAPVFVTPVRTPTPVVIEDRTTIIEQDPVDDGTEGTMDDRGAGLRAARRVVVGGGYGGMILSGDDSSSIGSSYRLHVGLALRQASVGLRLDLAPDALEVPADSGRPTSASYMISGLGFGYHFNPDGLLHPVMGASVELHSIDPDDGETAVGFGVGGRAGLEMEYPLDFGSLGVGLDLTAHRRLISDDDFPTRIATALAFGGYVDYRF
ncbi:MAG: hypothetical protein HYY06_16855 [Deltaproteobacteria bacterium]|nr:hypothetical protein [Deltaproteobacteria bacterium]